MCVPSAAPWRGEHIDQFPPVIDSNPAAIVDACFGDVSFLDASRVSPAGNDGHAQLIDIDVAGWSAESLAAAVAISLTRTAAIGRDRREQVSSPRAPLPR